MGWGLRRRCADLTCRLLLSSLPHHLRPWGNAVRHEVAHMPDHTEALFFAISGLGGLLPQALATHLSRPFVDDERQRSLSRGSPHMTEVQDHMFRPRRFAVACGAGAVLCGLAYLWLADAPSRYLATNGLAFLIGFVLLAILDRVSAAYSGWRSAVIAGAAAAILFTALLGESADGASRWARVGAIPVQPSLILLPLLVLAFAQTKDRLSTISVLVAAVALALQPDRGMAGVLAAGLIAIAGLRRDRMSIVAAVGATASFASTFFRPDLLPASPYVDQILYTAFEHHVLAGMAVLGGAFLLVLPALTGWARDPEARVVYAAQGTVWSATILAAAVGNYPTPVVGYGGSAILGYFLALAALPKTAGSTAQTSSGTRDPAVKPPSEPSLRIASSSA